MGRKITILFILAALAGAVFLAYKFVINKSALQPGATSTIDQVRKQEFDGALKKAAASDRDLDGLSDSAEAGYKTDPDNADTDEDGLTDSQEISIYKTDPLKADTDGDTFSDGHEVRRGENPNGVGKIK